jgi:hypothetical protein
VSRKSRAAVADPTNLIAVDDDEVEEQSDDEEEEELTEETLKQLFGKKS